MILLYDVPPIKVWKIETYDDAATNCVGTTWCVATEEGYNGILADYDMYMIEDANGVFPVSKIGILVNRDGGVLHLNMEAYETSISQFNIPGTLFPAKA